MDIRAIIWNLLPTVPHAISGFLTNRLILGLIRNSLCLTPRKGGGTCIPESWSAQAKCSWPLCLALKSGGSTSCECAQPAVLERVEWSPPLQGPQRASLLMAS